MPNYTVIRKLIPLIFICAMLLSSCQVFNLLWPKNSPVDIAEVLPDEAEIEALKKRLKIETGSRNGLPEVESDATVNPYLSFTLHYNFKANRLPSRTASDQSVEFVAVSGGSQFSSYKSANFQGTRNPSCGLNRRACTSTRKVCQLYAFMASFTQTCQFELTLSGELEDMNVVENDCIEYANIIANFPTFFIPPPDVIFLVTRAGEEVFLDQYHSVRLSNINLEYPIADTCPMK